MEDILINDRIAMDMDRATYWNPYPAGFIAPTNDIDTPPHSCFCLDCLKTRYPWLPTGSDLMIPDLVD